jgi:phage terminase small subunit
LKALSPQELVFIEEYLVDMNPREAAVRAGFKPGQARKHANALLEKQHVQEAIEAAVTARIRRLHLSQDRVLEEYARLAFSNIGDYVDWNAGHITVRAKNEITLDKRAAIQEITETTNREGTQIKLKLYDKKQALDAIAKHMGMFNEKLTIEMQESISDTITKGRQRIIEAERVESKLDEAQKAELHGTVRELEQKDAE